MDLAKAPTPDPELRGSSCLAGVRYRRRTPEDSVLYRVLAEHLETFLARIDSGQWVLTLPFRIRYLVAFDRELCREVRAVFLRTLLSWLRSAARKRGIPEGHSGAVTFTQRFGSSVNLNPHFHALVLDGVFQTDPGRTARQPSFRPAPPLHDADVEGLLVRVRNRILALLRRRGYLDDEGLPGRHRLEEDQPLLAACSAAARPGYDPSLRTTMPSPGPLCARVHGFSLHGNVRIPARERHRLERLSRYVARPAIASERLSRTEDGKVHYRFRRPLSDGSVGVCFDPSTFLERLAVLVPPPRSHLVVYSGVLAPNSSLRSRIVPGARGAKRQAQSEGDGQAARAGQAPLAPASCRRRMAGQSS